MQTVSMVQKLGIYKNMVADNMARYMVPQECGAKKKYVGRK